MQLWPDLESVSAGQIVDSALESVAAQMGRGLLACRIFFHVVLFDCCLSCSVVLCVCILISILGE